MQTSFNGYLSMVSRGLKQQEEQKQSLQLGAGRNTGMLRLPRGSTPQRAVTVRDGGH